MSEKVTLTKEQLRTIIMAVASRPGFKDSKEAAMLAKHIIEDTDGTLAALKPIEAEKAGKKKSSPISK